MSRLNFPTELSLVVLLGLVLTAEVGWAATPKKAEPIKRPPPPMLLLATPNTLPLPARPTPQPLPKPGEKPSGEKPTGEKPSKPPQNKPVKLLLRGLQLDTVTEARLAPQAHPGEPISADSVGAPLADVAVKITSKTKSPPPNQETAERYGDSELQLEFTLPTELGAAAGAANGRLPILVTGPGGVSAPLWLLIGPPNGVELHPEKDPNDGFRQAQAIPLPGAVDGRISNGQDVDVYRITGSPGQRVSVEVLAARHGSLLDGRITVYDSGGRELAAADDSSETGVDPRLELSVPADGVLLIVVSDAHETGGGFHSYRLLARPVAKP